MHARSLVGRLPSTSRVAKVKRGKWDRRRRVWVVATMNVSIRAVVGHCGRCAHTYAFFFFRTWGRRRRMSAHIWGAPKRNAKQGEWRPPYSMAATVRAIQFSATRCDKSGRAQRSGDVQARTSRSVHVRVIRLKSELCHGLI